MNLLERRLQDALLEAKRLLESGDIAQAERALDRVCATCEAAQQEGAFLLNTDALLDLVRACAVTLSRGVQ